MAGAAARVRRRASRHSGVEAGRERLGPPACAACRVRCEQRVAKGCRAPQPQHHEITPRRPYLMEAHSPTLEGALARTESDIEAALKATAAVMSQLKRAKKAAAQGVLRDLERNLEAADQLAGALRDSVRAARGGWAFDDRGYLGSGAFAK